MTTSYPPHPPFSHFEFIGKMQSATPSLTDARPTISGASSGVSDQQTPTAPYYFIGAGIATVNRLPEPAAGFLFVGVCAMMMRRRRGGVLDCMRQ